jgi:hypothetical protein
VFVLNFFCCCVGAVKFATCENRTKDVGNKISAGESPPLCCARRQALSIASYFIIPAAQIYCIFPPAALLHYWPPLSSLWGINDFALRADELRMSEHSHSNTRTHQIRSPISLLNG